MNHSAVSATSLSDSSSRAAAEELAATVTFPFDAAHAMPRSVYLSGDFVQQELDNIFTHDWFCAGRASALPNPCDYLSLELAGQPIMVIRGKYGQVRARYNVCLHRMSTLLKDRGCTEKLYRDLCSEGAVSGPLSHLDRPNNDFAQYLSRRIPRTRDVTQTESTTA